MRQKRAAQEPIAAEGRLVVVMVVSCRRLRFKGTTLHVNCHFSSPLGPLSLRSLVLPVDVVDEIKRLLFDVKLNGFREVLKHELARLNNMLWLGIVVALLWETNKRHKQVCPWFDLSTSTHLQLWQMRQSRATDTQAI